MVRYGIEKTSFVGPRIWNSISSKVKEPSSLEKSNAKNIENRKISLTNFVKPMFSIKVTYKA